MLHTEEKLTALCWQGYGKGLALLRGCLQDREELEHRQS